MTDTTLRKEGGGQVFRAGEVWVALLYVAVTLIVNLGAVLAIPKITTPAIAREVVPFFALPVLWAGYLLLRYWRSPLRFIGFVAAVPAVWWLLVVIEDVRIITRG